ncbi:MAG: hypothetical protein OWS74_00020 [Firmicutes bacterium]|nr:hypothetical protein [Bacillota bacterium]
MDTIGLFVACAALALLGYSAWRTHQKRYLSGRIIALIGEIGYFLHPQWRIMIGVFSIGVIWTVMSWWRPLREGSSRGGAFLDLSEMLAWLWMSLAVTAAW